MERNILVLARRDSNEAMRVAAGLTIFGHSVTLAMLCASFDQTRFQHEFEELLDLADIEPVTTASANIGNFPVISEVTLADEVINAEAVINL
ncbi:MAG: hypothetical protein KTR32_42005 [Granulosicoccus sp.]|nr:hypothetical protein [Granulosicoccus sp.]